MEQIGRNIIRLESIDSTNNYTANLIKGRELNHGSVIMAVEQTNGRGQMGAEWLVKPGENLTFSVFLDDVNLSVDDQFNLTRLVSLSLLDLLNSFGIEASIKWPNDIYVGTEKIAGILIENILGGKLIKKSIIGVGLNVNQTEFGALNATSLKMKLSNHLILDELLFSFIKCFNTRMTLGLTSEVLKSDYLDNLRLRNELAKYEDQDGVFEGTLIDVDQIGRLMVLKNEEVKKYSLKEIRFLT